METGLYPNEVGMQIRLGDYAGLFILKREVKFLGFREYLCFIRNP